MLIADLLIDVAMALWGPPERLLSATWRRFKERSAPLRALGIVLCTLIVLASIAVWAGILVLLIGGPILLLRELF